MFPPELLALSLILLALNRPFSLVVESKVTVTVAPMVTPFFRSLVAFKVEQLYSLLSDVRMTRSFIEALIMVPVNSVDGAVVSPEAAGVCVADTEGVTDGVVVGVGVTSTAVLSLVASFFPHPVTVNAVMIIIVNNNTFVFFIFHTPLMYVFPYSLTL